MRFHSTYKFQTNIDEVQIENVKNIVSSIVSKYSAVPVVFNEYKFDKTTSGSVIMLVAQKENPLYTFQKELVENLENLGIPARSEYPRFEENFLLHITIGRKLSDDVCEQAKSALPKNVSCPAIISDVTLTVVDSWTPKETENPKNRTVFEFYKQS